MRHCDKCFFWPCATLVFVKLVCLFVCVWQAFSQPLLCFWFSVGMVSEQREAFTPICHRLSWLALWHRHTHTHTQTHWHKRPSTFYGKATVATLWLQRPRPSIKHQTFQHKRSIQSDITFLCTCTDAADGKSSGHDRCTHYLKHLQIFSSLTYCGNY